MTTNTIPKPDVLYTESPVSWNTRYLSPEGFECQFTLRGESGMEVLEKANVAIAHLLNIGCSPVVNRYSNSKVSSDGNGNNQNSSSNGGQKTSWCPIHNVEMKRWEKNGRVWYSHKSGDEWCTGRPKRS
jgi:hypothetical protein